MLIKTLFWINISLFILHEMDAVKTGEWKMMILMNKLNDETGHIVFTLLHLPLFTVLFYLTEFHFENLVPAVSILLIIHQLVHILFRKHSHNRMNNLFSQIIIFLMFADSCITIFFLYVINK